MGTTMAEGRPGWAWVGRLVQTSDSAYPTGAYAHSLGLEALVEAGVIRDRESLGEFLRGQVLPQLASTDLALASLAWSATGRGPDWQALERLCFLGRSLRGTRELRQASEAVGRQRLQMAALLHGGIASELLERSRQGAWPLPSCVAAGVEGQLIGAPREAVLSCLATTSVCSAVAAAMKLLRLGQNAAQSLVAGVLTDLDSHLARAATLAEDQLGASNPWWDIASCAHERANFRLFIS